MTRSDDEHVADILDTATEVAALVAPSIDVWENDLMRRLAVERLLEITGESARTLSERCRARFPDVPWRDVVGLHVVLAHHYHRVDPRQVWTIANVELPRLVEVLRACPAN